MTSFDSLSKANATRQIEWDPSDKITLAFRGNELAGETGEACNIIKKLERERLGLRGTRATKEQLADELADIVICADLCATTAGIDLGAAIVSKFNATSEKYGLKTRMTHMRPDGITECSYMAAPQRTKPVEQVPASEPYPTNVVKVWQSKTTRWWLFDDGSVQCASIGSNAWFRANTTLAQLEACRCDTGDPVKLIYARESKPSEPPARTVEQEAEKWAEKVIAPNKLYDGAISFWDTTLPNGIPMNCGNFADTRLPNRLRSAMVRILTAFATTHATELQAKLSKANERVEAQARVIEEAQARVIEAWEDLHRKGHMEWNTCWAILGDAKSQLSKLEGT